MAHHHIDREPILADWLHAVMAAAARGDHGTAQDAIDFILDSREPWSASEFLPRWREGNLDGWPEFYEFLAARAAKSQEAA